MAKQSVAQSTQHKDITLILRDLLKVIKVVAMYPEGNPLPQSLKRSFSEKLVNLVETYSDIRIGVEKGKLTLGKETVYQDTSKEDSLAALFFDVGITTFTFKSGLDVNDIYKLLDVIKEYQNAPEKSNDLANRIWESGLTRFTFTTVEDVALGDYAGVIEIGALGGESDRSAVMKGQFGTDEIDSYDSIFVSDDSSGVQLFKGDQSGIGGKRDLSSGKWVDPNFYAVMPGTERESIFDENVIDATAAKAAEAAEAMGYTDLPKRSASIPDTALILNDEFKLSEEQEELITRMLVDDGEFDLYGSTVELLKELLHQESEMTDFFETTTLCEKIYDEFVRTSRLTWAAHLLVYFQTLEDQIRTNKPLWAERLKDARLSAGNKIRLTVFTEMLNGNAEVGAADMRRFLDHFSWESLGAITDLLGDLEHRSHREALCDFLVSKGKANVQVISKGLFDKRWFVVRNSVTILSRIGDAKSLALLKRVANHEETRVRMELVCSLRESPSDEALDILKTATRDSDAGVRKEAVRSIIARRGPAAFEAVTEIINAENFPSLDRKDQLEMLNAFSILGGQDSVEYLANLVTRYNLFRDPVLTFLREAGFSALTFNESEQAERLLINLCKSWRPDLARQAKLALRKRREVIFGGSSDE